MEILAFSRLSRSRGCEENNANVEDPNVTITKAPGDAVTVTLTLAVNNEGRLEPPVEDTMMIDVYDYACLAARIGKELEADYPSDFDGNCIIYLEYFAVMTTTCFDGSEFQELAEMATTWLVDIL